MHKTTVIAGWGDMNVNGHMSNTAYLDKSADLRMLYFASQGFPMTEFARLRFGPVVMKDELQYFREVNLLESVESLLSLAGLSPDGSLFRLRNDFRRADGQPCARITSECGWLDLAERRLRHPPEKLLAALRDLPRSDDYEDLPNKA